MDPQEVVGYCLDRPRGRRYLRCVQTLLHQAARQTDRAALAGLLAAMPAPPGAAAGVATATIDTTDAWGRTALYVAADTPGGGACVAALLAHGAAPNIPGPMGIRAALCARLAGRGAECQLLQAAGGTLDLGPLNEASCRCLLAHLFGLAGTTALHGVRLPLMGGWPEAEYVRVGEALAAAVPQWPSTAALPAAALQRLAAAFRAVPETLCAAPESLLARMAAGQTVLLPAAQGVGQAVGVVWCGGVGVRANRHRRPFWRQRGRCTLLAQLPSAAQLAVLQGSGLVQDGAEGPVWRALGRTRGGALQQLLNLQPPAAQRVANCSTASATGVLYAGLALCGLDSLPLLRGTYKRLTTWIRYYWLLQILQRHGPGGGSTEPPDMALLARCMNIMQGKRRAWLHPHQQHTLAAVWARVCKAPPAAAQDFAT